MASKPVKISKDSIYASQYEQLEELKKQVDAVQEEYLDNLNHIKGDSLIKKAPVIAKMREVFRTIPSFWATALRNTSVFTDIGDADVSDFITYIVDFEVVYNAETKTGGKIFMTFKENPYMKNTMLCRDIFPGPDGVRAKALKVKFTTIDWKTNKKIHPGPTKNKEDFSPGSFIGWLQDRNVLEIDLFILQEFFPACLNYYRDMDHGSEGDFTEDDELYRSGEDVSFDDEDDNEGYEDEPSDHEDQPASKKAKTS